MLQVGKQANFHALANVYRVDYRRARLFGSTPPFRSYLTAHPNELRMLGLP